MNKTTKLLQQIKELQDKLAGIGDDLAAGFDGEQGALHNALSDIMEASDKLCAVKFALQRGKLREIKKAAA